jgi:hypothetical protein
MEYIIKVEENGYVLFSVVPTKFGGSAKNFIAGPISLIQLFKVLQALEAK